MKFRYNIRSVVLLSDIIKQKDFSLRSVQILRGVQCRLLSGTLARAICGDWLLTRDMFVPVWPNLK